MNWIGSLPLLALVAASLPASSATAQSPAPDKVAAVKAALGVPAGALAPGCALGLFRGGKTELLLNDGYADVASARRINSDTQFYAASVSKQFTAAALMQLVVAGKVRLDDDVHRYLPDLPAYPDPLTIRNLLNMTGGVRDSLVLLQLDGIEPVSSATRAQALAEIFQQRDTKFTPGSAYDYTNGGYLMLSEVVEKVSGEKFESYVNSHVLKPLGMTRSFVMLGNRTTDANFARGYVMQDGKVTLTDDYPLFGGSGGLITTVNDLAKWYDDIDSGHKVWTAEITRLLTTPGRFTDGSPVRDHGQGPIYASALLIGPHWFHHTGAAGGFKTLFGYDREQRFGVAMLCNNGAYNPDKVADGVLAALDEGVPAVSEGAPPSSMDGRYGNPNLKAIYSLALTEQGGTVTITDRDGKPGVPQPLVRTGSGQYTGRGYTLAFDDNAKGFILAMPRVTLHFARLP
ncbi:serine hydrolase domain-containing protein [Sphingomonas sp. MMS24-J13]|uniref:serine hydrolase domain-containing protein n=1 Tax=Sphingomonas sp. MMS24-J13 TaxID=3238686 RepID=UPI00384DB5AE